MFKGSDIWFVLCKNRDIKSCDSHCKDVLRK